MKDPCEKCLISVVCSEVCFDKNNFNTLINSAMNQYKRAEGRFLNTPAYKSFVCLYKQNEKTISSILNRKLLNGLNSTNMK